MCSSDLQLPLNKSLRFIEHQVDLRPERSPRRSAAQVREFEAIESRLTSESSVSAFSTGARPSSGNIRLVVFSEKLVMNKFVAVTTGTALTLALGAVAAKPLALLGLGSLVVTVWAVTFDDSFASELFSEDVSLDAA